MMMRVKRLKSWARIPSRGTPASSGLDLSSIESVTIAPGETRVVMFGIAMSIPVGFEGQIRPRSSTSKRGILTHKGTVDQDYRGEVGATFTNLSQVPWEVQNGDRVAQLVIAPVELVTCDEVDDLDKTYRGGGGWGSTGIL